MDKMIAHPEVVSIYPHSTSEPVGQTRVSKRSETRLGARVGAGIKQEVAYVVT
jgi:hypothetical protein